RSVTVLASPGAGASPRVVPAGAASRRPVMMSVVVLGFVAMIDCLAVRVVSAVTSAVPVATPRGAHPQTALRARAPHGSRLEVGGAYSIGERNGRSRWLFAHSSCATWSKRPRLSFAVV